MALTERRPTVNSRPFMYMPKGAKWPWYPKFTTTVDIDDVDWEAGSFDLICKSPAIRGRVGLKTWWRNIRRTWKDVA